MTIVCNSVVYDRLRKQIISGPELLAANGYPHKLAVAHELSNNHYTELAGNMFNAFAIGAIFSSIFAVAPLLDTEDDVESSQPDMSGSGEEGCFEESGEEESSLGCSVSGEEEDA
jgi:hypothetical protein